MGRPRTFDEDAVLAAAADVFTAHGYEGTSIDDLVVALNLHRGSLYKAFGSKRGLFLAVLRRYVGLLDERIAAAADEPASPQEELASSLDLVLVAALERGSKDDDVAELVAQACRSLGRLDSHTVPMASNVEMPPEHVLTLLGARLYCRGTAALPASQPA